MKKEDKELYEKTIKDMKKLDYNALLILQTSIKMLVARQEMDKKPGPETAA